LLEWGTGDLPEQSRARSEDSTLVDLTEPPVHVSTDTAHRNDSTPPTVFTASTGHAAISSTEQSEPLPPPPPARFSTPPPLHGHLIANPEQAISDRDSEALFYHRNMELPRSESESETPYTPPGRH